MGFLTGKTAIITGAGRAVLKDGSCGSIGYGIATAYAKEGANLVITGRNVKKLEAAKQELESLYGIKVLTVQADVCAGRQQRGHCGKCGQAGCRYLRRHSGAHQQCTGFGLRRAADRAHHRAVRFGHLLRPLRRFLLHESLLPLSG